VANVIEEVQRPTLVLAHNKTLAAQLYSEFKQFFPNNAVEYFVLLRLLSTRSLHACYWSFIEKDLSINEELEKMRMSTTASLLSGRRDI
jgi:excinuclease ABC subunit B